MKLRVAVFATLCVVLIGACSAGDQSEPAVVASGDVPFGLVDRPPESPVRQDDRQPVALYFLGRDGLVQVDRPVDGEVTPERALRELLAGPSRSERDAGAASALVSSSAARFERARGGVARVALASGFRDSAIGNQPAALAEIVYTLTAFPEIERVSFSVEGKAVAVPRPDGSLTDAPVDRTDYAALVAGATAGG
jgi:spore germination protein GerM